MSVSPNYSVSVTTTVSGTVTVTPSDSTTTSPSRSYSIAVTWSPSLNPSLNPSYIWSDTYSPYSTYSAVATMPPTPTALWSPVLPSPQPHLPSLTPAPVPAPQEASRIGISTNELTIIFIVFGFIILISVINALHYNKKYKLEKQKRSLIEVRSNPLSMSHSQIRNIMPT